MFKIIYIVFIAAFVFSTPAYTNVIHTSGDRKGTLNQLPNYSPSGPYKLYFEMPDPNGKYMNQRR
jgi:hypothetical protein